ncbi:RCC1 domain-containing protein [Micromonospora sp. WMMD998]|uniref:RCC1 domain-containing protein n=1 Tax=Micromonospora sp. WMMD998 TaxID=3016092 RepID=UPI00249CEFA0|nr:RCC1 domain-containing protein [Micromonospora sp. WMMD998]WFE39282.1 cell wall anchor protein [Micromonospora sp. WMMD998]
MDSDSTPPYSDEARATTVAHRRRRIVAALLGVLIAIPLVGDAAPASAGGAPASRSTVPSPALSQARLLSGVIATAAGFGYSLALRSDGTVVAWGDNEIGQLGDGTTTDRLTPVRVCAVGQTAPCTGFLDRVVAIAADANSFHSLALLRDGTVVTWGANDWGQLGNGRDGIGAHQSTPVRVCAVGETAPCDSFLSGVRTIAGGGFHSMALLRDGRLVTWGMNSDGELGDGTLDNRSTPVRVCAVDETAPCGSFLSGVRTIAGGGFHSVAVVGNAAAVAWGYNGVGELGDGTTANRSTPVRVCAVGEVAPCDRFLSAVRSVTAGGFHTMALLGSGAVVSWGLNYSGELGDGTRVNRPTPVRVCAAGQVAPCSRFLFGIRAIAAGGFPSVGFHSMALLSSGNGVLTWGANALGELGDGTRVNRSTPVRVCAVGQVAPCSRFLFGIRVIAAGGLHSMALMTGYTVATWGGNEFGQLGDGTRTDRSTPVGVLAPD